MNQEFDAIIIGAGQAGPALAGRLTAAGQRVALIERAQYGGTCVNTGCTPTKALVASAYAAQMARRAADFGVAVNGPVEIDFAKVQSRKDAISRDSREGLHSWLQSMQGCTLFDGHARFVSSTQVSVNGETLNAPRIFINTGGRAVMPDFPGIDKVCTLDNVSLLQLTELPSHLIIIGGSYIGLEFAQIFRRLGSDVTIVERAQRLIAREDEDVSAAVRDVLEREGIRCRLDADCIRLDAHDAGVAVGVRCDSGDPTVIGSHVLIATGRRPNTDDMDLDAAGVAVDERGYIVVDDKLQTNVPGIWALGDCNGKGAFTHTAYNDFEIVAANLLDEDDRSVDDRIPCYALYIDPPLGRVGMTEALARKSGRRVLMGTRPMTRVARAIEKGESQGFMKVLVDADTREILGAAILGTGGDEAIHGLIDTMSAGAGFTVLKRTVHIHPTVSELIPTMLGELKPLV